MLSIVGQVEDSPLLFVCLGSLLAVCPWRKEQYTCRVQRRTLGAGMVGGEYCSKFDVGKEGKENHVYTKGTSTATQRVQVQLHKVYKYKYTKGTSTTTSGTPLDVHPALLFTGEDLLRVCRGSRC